MEKKKVGIMGGTFNPIHIGHLLLAQQAKEDFSLDQVLFIPSGCSYMKGGSEVADKYLRLEMTRLAIEGNPAFLLSDMEVEREGNSYTFETLAVLQEEEPDSEFYFIVGADTIFDMERWVNPQAIFQSCTILAAVRPEDKGRRLGEGIAYLEEKYHAHIWQVSMNEINVSSTDIRKRIRENRSIRYMVPDKVISFIEENCLYQKETV